MKKMKLATMAATGLMLAALSARANNLVVTNVTAQAKTVSTALVKFDIRWENSWRYTNVNHDAAWVFFKVQPQGSTDWQHVTLQGAGTNPPGYSTGAGTGIEIIVPDDRVGMFVRRSAQGAGTTAVQNVQAIWNFATNGLTSTNKVRMQVLAVEMVYVSQGSFQVGDGTVTTLAGQLEDGTSGTPFAITNEAYAITLGGGGAGSLGNNNNAGVVTADDFNDGTSQALPAEFPKGYAAFYCMKYEITQGQYADFLNTLTEVQASARYYSSSASRYTISGSYTNYTAAARDRACNFLSWMDGLAFADWAGLRPMTELEFEKACRGPTAPVPGELAWGTTNISATTAIVNDVTGTDTATGGNCNYNACSPIGPYRAGIYATGNSLREAAGASYWGIMDLSGSILERAVTLGTAGGRSFTGMTGDGQLAADGKANVAAWSATMISRGGGLRGGGWGYGSAIARVSDRWMLNYLSDGSYVEYRIAEMGWRAARQSPSGVGP